MEIGSKGIARISIVPLRSDPSDKAEIVSQLLFGDHYTVTDVSENSNWVRIKISFDGYEGWIDSKQYHSISEDYFNQINNSDFKICLDITSTILFNKNQTNIVMGSILPISSNEIFKIEEQLAFNGEAKNLSEKRDVEFLFQTAKKYLNTPYLWGGRSPFGIDCSGFVQIVFRISGYHLPRDAKDQITYGQDVDYGEMKMGDLAFFKNQQNKITHVGIVMDKQRIIHASGKVRIDELTQSGIIHSATGQQTHELHSIKRVLSSN